jgi:hypothetical protein
MNNLPAQINEPEVNTRIIEIGGVKMEVDLRHAKTVEHYKVGDPIKILIEEYSDTWKSYPGVIVGFVEFKSLPAIEILYIKDHYGSVEIEFKTFTSASEKVEIAPYNEFEIGIDRAEIMEKFDVKINKLREEIRLIENRRTAFDKYFGSIFADVPTSE